MKKMNIIIIIFIILICSILSGCNNSVDVFSPNIEILNYNISKSKLLLINRSLSDGYSTLSLLSAKIIIPFELDVQNISSNLSLRKYVCLKYFNSSYDYSNRSWDNDYWGYMRYVYNKPQYYYKIHNFTCNNKIYQWKINGTAKNIDNEYFEIALITVNFYNINNSWLAHRYHIMEDIPSGYTWNFIMSYGGQFKEDVHHIDFYFSNYNSLYNCYVENSDINRC